MSSLVLKLILTPALIGAASLAGRRWGSTVSGWLVGLPLTSGPVAFFLALNHGAAFAAAAAVGTLTGTMSQAPFCLTYGWLARRSGWPLTLGIGYLAFAAATVALQNLAIPLVWLFLLVITALVLALCLMPRGAESTPKAAPPPPRWDIPARMVVATAFVLLLTGLAPVLGARLTGLLAPFPLYASILAVFAHRLQGGASAVKVLRGLLFGLFAFAGFFLALALLIERVGIAPAFARPSPSRSRSRLSHSGRFAAPENISLVAPPSWRPAAAPARHL
ncbi:MAG TPA: hypothetical protein VH599_20070 [Ktedonobacterales bacterium]|jgi:hypothetical protein